MGFDRWIYCHYLDVQPSHHSDQKSIISFVNSAISGHKNIVFWDGSFENYEDRSLPFFDPSACTVFITWVKSPRNKLLYFCESLLQQLFFFEFVDWIRFKIVDAFTYVKVLVDALCTYKFT